MSTDILMATVIIRGSFWFRPYLRERLTQAPGRLTGLAVRLDNPYTGFVSVFKVLGLHYLSNWLVCQVPNN